MSHLLKLCRSLPAKLIRPGDELACGRPDADGCLSAVKVLEVGFHLLEGTYGICRRYQRDDCLSAEEPSCGFSLHATGATEVLIALRRRDGQPPLEELVSWWAGDACVPA